MGIYVNPGNEKYKRALRGPIYVDKSGMLEYTNRVLSTESSCICMSRPRRFGKSITAAMIAAYYSKGCDSKELFEKLKISKCQGYEEYINSYDVIHVDMNVFRYRRDGEKEETISALGAISLFHKEIIAELQEQYPDSVAVNAVDLPAVLSRINRETGAKFIIIIDEWDTIFREDKTDIKAQKAYIELLRGLFKHDTAKEFLALGYLTGILPVKKYGTESALNNFDEYTMARPAQLAEYVGFTEEEVHELCKEYHMDFKEMKRWYDGYSFRRAKHIYSPNSVVKAISFDEFGNYWTSTETYESLKTYINMNFDGLKDAIVAMLSGGRCKIDISTFENDMVSFGSCDDVLTVLMHLGYLAYDSEKCQVYIPNEEVRSAFVGAIKKCDWTPVVKAINASDKLLQATWQKNEKVVAEGIEKVHMNNVSVLQYNDENSLSCVISLAYYNAINEYTLIREMPAGEGYADIVFLPRKNSDKPAMIVELKWNRSVESAIEQIKRRQYASALAEYKGNLLLVAINYDKESKKHQCKIEQMDW